MRLDRGSEWDFLKGGNATEWAFRKAGEQIKGAIDETRLGIKEGFLRGGAEVGDAIGLDHSAKYLKHFLDGSGKDIVVPRDDARKDPFIRDAEIHNRGEFENKTFIGMTGNAQLNNKIRSLKDGESVSIDDFWDRALNFKKIRQKSYKEEVERLGEPDGLLSFGSLNLKSTIRSRARRDGNKIYITGMVGHKADDDYNFEPGDYAYGAYEIQQVARGKPFKVIQNWEQNVEGTVDILGADAQGKLILGNPSFNWVDRD